MKKYIKMFENFNKSNGYENSEIIDEIYELYKINKDEAYKLFEKYIYEYSGFVGLTDYIESKNDPIFYKWFKEGLIYYIKKEFSRILK